MGECGVWGECGVCVINIDNGLYTYHIILLIHSP